MNHDGAHERTGVGGVRGPRSLGDETFLARADHVSPKGNPARRRSETKPMAVTGQLACRIGRKEIDVIAE